MSGAAISTRGLVCRAGDAEPVGPIELDATGGVISVLGPNGAGKSTLLRCLATVTHPVDGSVHVDGLDATDAVQRTEIRRRLGYVPQDPGLNPGTRVFDAVDYHAVLRGLGPPRSRRLAVMEALDEVGMRDRARDRVRTLSGGMRRRVALALALLGRPRLIVLDEPSAELDPDRRLELREVVSRRAAEATIVIGTHLVHDAEAVSTHCVVLDAGRVVASGPPAAIARSATGKIWVQETPPETPTRASWQMPDGRWRCVGHNPPKNVTLVEPTLEDAYLLLVSRHR